MPDGSSQTFEAAPGEVTAERYRPARSLIGQLGLRVLGRWGARLGLAWIALLIALAVLAPLIANSHPLLMRTDQGWSSPMARHLTPIDVTLFVAALVGVVCLALHRVSRRLRIWTWLGVVALTAVLASLFVSPPQLSVMSRYREMEASGRIQWALHAPIAFSPTDRLQDVPMDPRLEDPGWHPSDQDVASAIISQAESATGLTYDPGDRPANAAATQRADAAPRAETPSPPVERARAAAQRLFQRYLDQADGYERVVTDAERQIDNLADTPRNTRFHLMGTTAYGEDLASRMIHASRIALAIGFIATGISVVIGVFIGGLMGYFSGWVDLLGMRLVEIFSAIPQIFLLIAIVAFYGRSLYLMMTIIGLTGWVGYALFIRAEFLKLRQQDYVTAARACGTPLRSILFKHMLPNGIAPVLVNASFGVAAAILAESTLSFLGLGLVEEPSWGQMLDQARGVGGSFYWWIALYPGGAIFLTVFAYNLVGEALRDAIDPRLQGSNE